MKRVFTTIIAVVAVAQLANAQSTIKNESLTRQKRTISVSFDIDSQASNLSSMLKEVITPYLYNGADTLWLNPVEIYGKGRYKREAQENHINGNKEWELGKRQIMKGATFHFDYKGEVKPWMTTAHLSLQRTIIGCSKCDIIRSNESLAKANLYIIPPFSLEKIHRRWDFGQDDLAVTFEVSKIDINHNIFDNEATFAKLLAAVDKIHSNPHYKIDKIQVSGFASPEGTTKFNTWLGENRAKALINYIIEQRPSYGLTEENFEIVNGEENWSGLRKVLEASNMAEREAVIAIIDNPNISGSVKKSKIKAMDRGRIWNKMLKEIYPQLRSARYLALYYDSTNDNRAEVINQANELINKGQHAEAYNIAIAVAEDERAHNTIGVALMAQGKFTEALTWFKRAVDGGSAAAQKNIEAIEAEYGPMTK